jgi:hemolysin activation/secretion protein
MENVMMTQFGKRLLGRSLTLCLVLFLTVFPVLAAQRPDAGQTSESLLQQPLTAPSKATSSAITVEREQKPPLETPLGQRFLVTTIQITGINALLDSAELAPLYHSLLMKEVSMGEVRATANRITTYLREHGYLVAYAYIPTQDVTDGNLEIAILPGRYGRIRINSTASLAKSVIQSRLGNLHSGAVIHRFELERAILLLNDVSGISAKAMLLPGSAIGEADVVIEVLPDKTVEGSVSVDNFGNRFTGVTRYSVSASRYTLSSRGDQARLNAITSGNGLISGSLTYQIPFGGDGGTLSVAYSDMYYELGETFASLNANGRAKTTSINWSYPLLRSRNADLYLQIGFDDKTLYDSVRAANPPTIQDKHAHTVNIGISGNSRDNWGGGGANAYSLAYSAGRLAIDTPTLRDNDALTAKTAGNYQKYSLRLVRQQMLRDNLSLLLSFTGQAASKNLDSSEKMSLGGAYGVRAYPQGEAPGDQVYIVTAELRQLLSKQKLLPGQLQLALFFDAGSAMLSKHVWDHTTPNRRKLYSVGTGLIWFEANQYSLRLDYARKIGSAEAESDTDKAGRFWLQGTRYF